MYIGKLTMQRGRIESYNSSAGGVLLAPSRVATKGLASMHPQSTPDVLCACGCGEPVNWHRGKPRQYRVGHATRGKPRTEAWRDNVRVALKRYNERPDSHLRRNHGSEEQHPNWKGGIKASVYQRRAGRTADSVCELCGSKRSIDVHHRDENRYNSDPANLVILCRSCHLRAHRGGLEV